MQELINRYLANNLTDFKGMHVAGVIPIKQEVINELITTFLRDGIHAATQAQSTPSPARPNINANSLLKLVKKVEVRADAGTLFVSFEIQV